MRAGRLWPLAIAALLAGSVGAHVVLVVVATRDPSFAVEKDYYRKALAWDETMAQERRNAELGWSTDVTVAAGGRGGGVVTARITDRGGRPVEGARVAVEALHNARAAEILAATLAPDGPGRYAAPLPLTRPGLWEIRLRVERGAEVFTAVLTRDVAGAP